MSKIFLFMMTSLDGYFEGEDHDLSWHNIDEEFSKFANDQLDEVDTLIFGHRTYELMANFWPTEEASKAEPGTAIRMNSLKKVVFSKKPLELNWNNSESYTEVREKLSLIKKQADKDIAVIGSSNLCLTLIHENLLDELRIMINPVVLGKGSSLFSGLDTQYKFKLTSSRVFNNGNILLRYSVKS